MRGWKSGEAEEETTQVAAELSGRYEEIDLIYTISEILGHTIRLDEAASRILREVSAVVRARRATGLSARARARGRRARPSARGGGRARSARRAPSAPAAYAARGGAGSGPAAPGGAAARPRGVGGRAVVEQNSRAGREPSALS